MEKDIIEIARQIVENKSFKTLIEDKEQTLNYLIKNKLVHRDSNGIWLNKEFINEYKELLIENGFTKYEIMIIEIGPYGLVYFKNELVQFFIHNPNYKFIWDGYRGHIIKSTEKTSLNVYLENLCLAYDLKHKVPIIAIFLKDLILDHDKTFLEFLQYFEISNQSHLMLHPYNYKELIECQWLKKEEEDIYLVILNGMEIINKIFMQKYNRVFFNKIPEIKDLNYFRPIYFPTKLNYYLYIMELYKIFLNIKVKTLKHLTNNKEENSLFKLIEIYTSKYNLDERIHRRFKETINKISDIRNIPAHEFFENIYDEDYWRQQDYFNEQLYIFINMIIKNEIKDTTFEFEKNKTLFGNNGGISLWNGFNIPPYNYFDNQICAICERFEQRDAEILIAFKNTKNIKKQFFKYCKNKGTSLNDERLTKFIELLFNDLCEPSKTELISFFKGYCFYSNIIGESMDDSYIENGIKMYEDFVQRYPLKNCMVIADMSDIRYTIDEINSLDTLKDSGLIYNTIFDDEINLTTNPKEDCDIQVLVNTWD